MQFMNFTIFPYTYIKRHYLQVRRLYTFVISLVHLYVAHLHGGLTHYAGGGSGEILVSFLAFVTSGGVAPLTPFVLAF